MGWGKMEDGSGEVPGYTDRITNDGKVKVNKYELIFPEFFFQSFTLKKRKKIYMTNKYYCLHIICKIRESTQMQPVQTMLNI